jgi:hypothetical protein
LLRAVCLRPELYDVFGAKLVVHRLGLSTGAAPGMFTASPGFSLG